MRKLMVACALALGACGGSEKDFETFLGTYNTTGNISYSGQGCPAPAPTAGTLTIERGPPSDLVVRVGQSCVVPLNITGGNTFDIVSTTCGTTSFKGHGTVNNKLLDATVNGNVSQTCQYTQTIRGPKQ